MELTLRVRGLMYPSLLRVVRLVAVATLGIACGGNPTTSTVNRPAAFDGDASKVDPAVLAAMSKGDSVSAIVLGRSQLLERVGGLERFQQAHAGQSRQSIRSEVIANLQATAASDHAAIRSVIGAERGVRELWIYNAVGGTFSQQEIARLSQLENVAFIFANERERVVFPTGKE